MSNTRRPGHPLPDQSASRWTPVIVVVAVLSCIGALAVIAAMVGGADEGSTGAGSGSGETATVPPGECAPPPALPESPRGYTAPPDPSKAEGTSWTATIATNCGDIVVELDGAKAPQTVASFLTLAKDGYWDDSPCHRLTTENIFVLQCGDPTGTGSGNPGYGYGVENAPPDGQYPAGTMAMARTQDPNSNGGQFFIVYDDTQLPDPVGYTIFGEVTKGLDIVSRIADEGVDGGGGDGAPAQPISILDVTTKQTS